MAAGREHTQRDIDCSIYRHSCKIKCCKPFSFCNRASTKERNKSWLARCQKQSLYIKICQWCFFCHSVVLCPTCGQCPSCCTNSTCTVQTSKLLANLTGNGCRSENSSNTERGLHPPFWIRPNLTRSPMVISCYVNPHRNSYPMEALHQLIDKNAVELVHNQTSLGFFN